MTASLIDIADKVWRREMALPQSGLFLNVPPECAEVVPGIATVPAFSNVMPIDTGDGLLVVDTSHAMSAPGAIGQLRRWSSSPVRTVVYTHGHLDHVGGAALLDAQADERGEPRPSVIAHEAVPARFARYALTAGYNASINRRQFGVPGLTWPTSYREPDVTYATSHSLDAGSMRIDLRHARGETDDHTWVWLPDQRVLYPGDLFIWCVPNAGNPQKVQRYARDWAIALREMIACEPEIMLPSHGLPIVGAERVRTALDDTASLLESLHDQTVSLMNDGATLDVILHSVQVPDELREQPYLQPIYDDPEFVVRNVWRHYGGWWDGDPSSLKPARRADLAAELATLAGGPDRLAQRAVELAEQGELRTAGHLAQLAFDAAPDDPGVRDAYAAVNRSRMEAEPSLMAKAVFRAAARDASAG